MKRFVPLIADAVLAAVCAFLLFFTLVRFYFSTAAGLAAGIIGGLAAGAGAFAYIAAKQSRSASLSAGKREAEKLAVHLACIPQSEAEELFMRCLDEPEQKDGRIECEGEAYFTKFCMEPCDRDDLLPAARFKTDKKKYFVCNAATAACAEFAADCGVEIICADGVYERLKARGALPEKYTGEVKKVKFFARIKSRFSKKLCLPSFASGAALLFFSYFTYYPIYYIVTGSLLLLLCLAAAVFGRKKGA